MSIEPPQSGGSEAPYEISPELRQKILEARGGRPAGWTIELAGEPVALLTIYEFYDMFWDRYEVVFLTEDEVVKSMLFSSHFWDVEAEERGIQFRNREFPEVPTVRFPIVTLSHEEGKLHVRALYLATGPEPPEPAPKEDLLSRIDRWTSTPVLIAAGVIGASILYWWNHRGPH